MPPPPFPRGGPGAGRTSLLPKVWAAVGGMLLLFWIYHVATLDIGDSKAPAAPKSNTGKTRIHKPPKRVVTTAAPEDTEEEATTTTAAPTRRPAVPRHAATTVAPLVEVVAPKPDDAGVLKNNADAAPKGGEEGGAPPGRDTQRRDVVIEALKYSWDGYAKHAFGKDEFMPVSFSVNNWGNGRGVGTIIADALDTLLLAGLKEEADAAIKWIELTLSYDQPAKLSVFETTIRIIGGLVSAFQITNNNRVLEKANDLGTRLMVAFQTSTGIPDNYVNLQTHSHEGASWNGGQAILSELGSLQMEFASLGQEVQNPVFVTKSIAAIEKIRGHCGTGFCPRFFSGSNPAGGNAGLGSFGDSFYEYLLKMWILSDKTEMMYKEMWDKAADHIIKTSVTTGGHLIPNGGETGGVMEHLACFSGGLFALSYMHTDNKEHLDFGEKIAETCRTMYESTATKLAPDVARINSDGSVQSQDPKYILRPETVETYFYLWRATKNPKYRDWGYDVMVAINKHLRVKGGYAGSTNTGQVPTTLNDNMESFWFAETLKYLLLLFSEDEALDLHKFVFNTEAHPLRVVKGGFIGRGDKQDFTATTTQPPQPPKTPPPTLRESVPEDDGAAIVKPPKPHGKKKETAAPRHQEEEREEEEHEEHKRHKKKKKARRHQVHPSDVDE